MKRIGATILLLAIFLLPACAASPQEPTTQKTPKAVKLIDYQGPWELTYGTINPTIVTDPKSTSKTTDVTAIGVTLDSGEDIIVEISPSLWTMHSVGSRISLESVEDQYGLMVWKIFQIDPVEMPPAEKRMVDGTLPLNLKIDDLLTVEGRVWVLGTDADGNKNLARLDPDSGQVAQNLQIAPNAKGYGKILTGDGALWVYIPPTLYQVDPQALQVVESWEFEGGPAVLAVWNGKAWMTRFISDTRDYDYFHYDLQTKTENLIAKTENISDLVLGENYAYGLAREYKELYNYATDKKQSVLTYVIAKVDPLSGEFHTTTAYSTTTSKALDLALGYGSVWLPMDNGYLVESDTESGKLISVVPMLYYSAAQKNDSRVELSGIAYGADALWIGHPASGSLLRVDPKTKYITHVFLAKGKVSGPQVGETRIWMIIGSDTIAWVDLAPLSAQP